MKPLHPLVVEGTVRRLERTRDLVTVLAVGAALLPLVRPMAGTTMLDAAMETTHDVLMSRWCAGRPGMN